MDAKQKQRFIKDLCNAIRNGLVEDVRKMPEHWDGHELRAIIAERAKAQLSVPMQNPYGGRRKDFENELVIRNL